jgi:lipopolysaccharide export system permease protein
MKKIDKLLLGAFVGPFMMTFLVVVFILLTQHMLKYFDDIIGKGLGADVIGQLLFYFAIFMTPVALPLAVLLSSLIAFGNLGEHFELTAIKSSGISLVRTLRPIFFFVLLLTIGAFYANNNLVPKAALEAYSLLYDIKQKKPALDLREGAFYNGIPDISIKVNKKFEDGITLKDVVVYDHRKNDGNKEVTIADSGKMYTILNERYLKFELFKGYNYAENAALQKDASGRGRTRTETLTRSKFDKSQIVFDLTSIQFSRTEKKWFQGNRIMRNLAELNSDMDSIKKEILTQRLNYYQYQPSYFNYLNRSDTVALPPELRAHQKYQDSLLRAKFTHPPSSRPEANPERTVEVRVPADSLSSSVDSATAAAAMVAPIDSAKIVIPQKVETSKPKNAKRKLPPGIKRESMTAMAKKAKEIQRNSARTKAAATAAVDSTLLTAANSDSVRAVILDSLFKKKPSKENFQGATSAARQVKTNIQNTNASAETYSKELVTFKIQWHKILASSLACVAMFLIGAPLGAIIKKGGLGMPFLVSIIFFIIYYVITMQGEKLAKQGTVSPWVGVWMADMILFVIGLLFLRQARADARLFEADFYNVVFDKVKRWFAARKNRVPTPQVQ